MSSFPMMSNINHCKKQRLHLERAVCDSQPAVVIAPQIVKKEISTADNKHSLEMASKCVPAPMVAKVHMPVCKPIIARLSKESIFSNVQYLMAQKN